ncbi:recombinase family protein [Mycolicibacterium neoaurum]|uniref:recombinase family protein n=1 Tax=Mycolicibacterium neoaurum TaxID=1795 RepID=UPI001F4CBC6F|nr:recombinase family protein [Mycolicibacterium neoaurum]
MKALIVIRLSRVTDATTSPERQLAECRDLIAQRGYEEIGIAQDLDVSGAVDPFKRKDRPNLARWLAGEEQPFDVIVVYRVDRLTRSIRHLQKLVAWAEDHKRLIVSATEPHFDMTTPFAAVVIALMGTVAQMELEAISERNASAARHNIRAGKYRGSQPPWGYLPSNDTGEWRLIQDPEQVEVIQDVARRVIDGEPLQRIAHELTRTGVLTPKDLFAQHRGREIEGREWSVTQLKRSLLSETMLGYAMSGGKPVRNEDGSPVVRSEPILTREVFDRIRVELAGRARRGEPSIRSSSLLLRVLHCGTCQLPAYKFNGGSHSQFPRYRCKSMTSAHKCGNGTVPQPKADKLVEDAILSLLGSSERLERVWDQGSDNSGELADINAELADLADQLGSPAFRRGTPQRDRLDARIEALAARQAALEAEATVPAGWTWKPTGERFGNWWDQQDVTARNVWLRSMNVRAEFERELIRLDLGDLETLTEHLDATGSAADWQNHFAAMTESGIAGIELTGDGVVFVLRDGQRVRAADLDGSPSTSR